MLTTTPRGTTSHQRSSRRPADQGHDLAIGLQHSVTGGDGRWKITDLPIDFPLVVGVMPPFDVGLGPCRSEGPPPVPAVGQPQPEFFTNTWVDLDDEAVATDAYSWGIAHGAQSTTNSKSGIDLCLTTDPGTVVPRPPCVAATSTPQPTDTALPTPSATSPTVGPASSPPTAEPDSASGEGSSLANTGGPAGWLVALAAGLLALGVTVFHRSHRRRR